MNTLEKILNSLSATPISILDSSISLDSYTPIDLSIHNKEISNIAINDPYICQEYINKETKANNAIVAYGGYLEQRSIYTMNTNFSKAGRNIHIALDFWAPEATKVITPVDGEMHSFKNNATKGDYGPTIILKHTIKGITFYSLYGHLSLESLKGLYIGKKYIKGEELGSLGEIAVNVNYAPHLHFQIIKDIGSYKGDYPGVAANKDIEYYKRNCPNPNLLLKL